MDAQAFVPYAPFRYDAQGEAQFVGKNIVQVTRKKMKIDPDASLHLTVRVFGPDGVILYAYTTDESLEGTSVDGGQVRYEIDKFIAWSERDGLIHVSRDLDPSWSLNASYFYESDDYEYSALDLNPTNNESALSNTYVVYLKPNIAAGEYSLHHLVIDENRVVIEASDEFIALEDGTGSYNSNTIVGSYYDFGGASFRSLYVDSTVGYMVIAEVGIADIRHEEFVVDVRRHGATVTSSDVYTKNPRLLHSGAGFGPEGQPVPKRGLVFVDLPITLTQAYGGIHTPADVLRRARTGLPAGVSIVPRWSYPEARLTANMTTVGQADLSWDWVGAYTYNLYRSDSRDAPFVLIDSQTPAARTGLAYSDATVTSGQVYWYELRVEVNGTEMPGNKLQVRVM